MSKNYTISSIIIYISIIGLLFTSSILGFFVLTKTIYIEGTYETGILFFVFLFAWVHFQGGP